MSKSLSILYQNDKKDDQIRWEYTKFEIRQFSITSSKNLFKSLNVKRKILEKELKDFDKFGSSYFDNEDCLACRTKLDKIYDKKVEGLIIRSKCYWCEKGEKSTKFLLILGKRHAIQNEIKTSVVNDEVNKLKSRKTFSKIFIKNFFLKITVFLDKRGSNIYEMKTFRN